MNNKFVATMQKIEPDSELKEKTHHKIFNSRPKKNKKVLALASSVAAVLCVAVCVYFFAIPSVTIPTPKISVNPMMDQFLFFVYKHKIYVDEGPIDYADAQKILDKELGTTTSEGLEEYKLVVPQDAVISMPDFTSISPDMKIYSVKGYDKDVRLIAIEDGFDGKKYAKIYDSPYGLTVRFGWDFLHKFSIRDITAAEYRTTYSVGKKTEKTELKYMKSSDLAILKAFVKDMNFAKPYAFADGTPIEKYTKEFYKTIFISTKNGIPACLDIWKNGDECFVSCWIVHEMIFTINSDNFEKLWEVMP